MYILSIRQKSNSSQSQCTQLISFCNVGIKPLQPSCQLQCTRLRVRLYKILGCGGWAKNFVTHLEHDHMHKPIVMSCSHGQNQGYICAKQNLQFCLSKQKVLFRAQISRISPKRNFCYANEIPIPPGVVNLFAPQTVKSIRRKLHKYDIQITNKSETK